MKLKVLDLFSGIGAYALGLERAGMEVIAFCESDPFCRRVLKKHWPEVPIYDDVRTLTGDALSRDGITPDVICGGWPCQDLSPAGTRLGLDGERSGLWSEVARLLGEFPSCYAILENSSNLLSLDGGRWFGRILGDLAALGRHVEWHSLSAAGFDAPHIRDRLWITIFPVADAAWDAKPSEPAATRAERERICRQHVAHPDSLSAIGSAIARQERHTWLAESGMDRVAPRTSTTVDRIRALGNCNPPVIPETIGRALLEVIGA